MNEDPTITSGVTQDDKGTQPGAHAAPATWGSFTLLARVGAGGFGEVYRAWDSQLRREVALKLLLPGTVAGKAEYEAMLREARALASVRHPNIVPIHGIDRHEGRVGFWTDFVRGKTLTTLVREQRTFGAHEAALIGLDVARALSAVHRAGLLHRDIKAENVMREEGGRILLMDFGLSSLEHREINIAGTPNYMAPELFDGGKSTVATDIYAMGVLLYFLVSGDYPVRVTGFSRAEASEAFQRRRPLIDLRADLPESLLRTVSTATELDPVNRFKTAGQLANALAESLGSQAPLEVSIAPPRKPRFRRRYAWLLVTSMLAVAMIAGLVWPGNLQRLLRRTSGSETAAANEGFLQAQGLLLRSYKEANLAEAIKGFKAVLQADPDFALAEARLGAAYFAQHGYSHDPKLLEMAKDAASRAVKLEPDLAAPYITLARIAASEGQTQFATQQVRKALALEPRSAEAHGALGEVYEAQGRTKDGIAEYQKAVALDPSDWRWPMSLGVAEYTQGNISGAISQFQRGAELAPDNAVAFYDLSIAHRQMGNLEQARTELERSIQLDPTARKFASLGSLLLFEGKHDEATEMEKKAIALNPTDYVGYLNLGSVYSWSGKHHDEAVQAYRKAIDLMEADRAQRPQDPSLLASLAGTYASVGDSTKSLVLARQALALASDDPTVEYKIGEAFELLGRREAAIPLIAKAIANGYNTGEFDRSPELANLRADPKFNAMLTKLKEKSGPNGIRNNSRARNLRAMCYQKRWQALRPIFRSAQVHRRILSNYRPPQPPRTDRHQEAALLFSLTSHRRQNRRILPSENRSHPKNG